MEQEVHLANYHCNREQLKDCEIIEYGFQINRHIKDAINIFNDVNIAEFLKLPPQMRYGLTNPPVSEIAIISVSPLHSYLCVLMVLAFNLPSKCWA